MSAESDFRQPEWIELRWQTPCTASEAHTYFDVDLDHHLRNIGATYDFRTYPECVRDYRLYIQPAGAVMELVAAVCGNYQRHCVHTWQSRPIEALRLEICATNGARQAHVYEIAMR